MVAVIEISGKQYTAKVGDLLKVGKLPGEKGDKLTFSSVLAVSNDKSTAIGSDAENSKVEAELIDQIKDKKVIVFKKKRRHNYRRKNGHRQQLSLIKITSIN